MENNKIAYQKKVSDDKCISKFRVECNKCAGSGHFKTPENSRRTCLECFGKGYKVISAYDL